MRETFFSAFAQVLSEDNAYARKLAEPTHSRYRRGLQEPRAIQLFEHPDVVLRLLELTSPDALSAYVVRSMPVDTQNGSRALQSTERASVVPQAGVDNACGSCGLPKENPFTDCCDFCSAG